MSGFVANGNSPDPEAVIINNGFFPDIDPAKFRAATRQDKTVTEERLRQALLEAIAAVNRELSAWQLSQQESGHADLGSLPQPQIGDEGILTHHYRRAVYGLAKAELLERYRDFDATRSGAEREDENPAADDIYRRDARWAIADLQGKRRTVVEMI